VRPREYQIEDGGSVTLDQTRSHNKANEIDTDDDHTDAAGNAIAASTGDNWIDPTYDAAGNMGSTAARSAPTTRLHFTYDAWNRLVAYTDSGDNVIAEYRYDGLNRRIAKMLAGDDWDRTDYYYNEAWQVLEERFAEDVDEADKDDPATTMRCQYVWDIRYIDAPVVRFRDTNGDGTADDTLYYCNDANMNVTALVNASDGSVAERYEYDPYGNLTVLNPDWSADAGNASDYDNEMLYAGYRHDPESALCQVRNRYYHTALGRWVSRDPAGYLNILSLYQYCLANPIARVDASGEQELITALTILVITEYFVENPPDSLMGAAGMLIRYLTPGWEGTIVWDPSSNLSKALKRSQMWQTIRLNLKDQVEVYLDRLYGRRPPDFDENVLTCDYPRPPEPLPEWAYLLRMPGSEPVWTDIFTLSHGDQKKDWGASVDDPMGDPFRTTFVKEADYFGTGVCAFYRAPGEQAIDIKCHLGAMLNDVWDLHYALVERLKKLGIIGTIKTIVDVEDEMQWGYTPNLVNRYK